MNVYLFKISVSAKKTMQDIIESVISEYKNKSVEKDYKSFVQKQWELEGKSRPQIGYLYSKEHVLAFKKIHGDHYYIVDADHSDSVETAFLDVLVLSEMENVDESFNAVFSDIRKTLKNSFNIEMKQKFAWLYIFSGCDIYTHEVKVKANVISTIGLSTKELIRLFTVVIVSVGAFFLLLVDSSNVKSIGISIGCSGLVFLLSEIPIHISTKKRIEIPEFTNDIFEKSSKIPIISSSSITTPDIEE